MKRIWVGLAAVAWTGCIYEDHCVEGAVRVDGHCMFLDDGGTDGDAMVDPNVPSAPTVRIDPETPRTLDDLTASIVEDSVDPLGDTVTYEYAWLNGDTPSGTTTPTLSHDLTTKHETWTVRVTPVAGDRRGAAGTASVTIANTPPEVITAGLSTYHPIADERIRAYPDGTTDADGDTTTFTFTWLHDGEPVPDLAGDTIDLGLAGFAADDTLGVEVRATDGDDTGPPFTLGPFPVLPAVTQWRPILPDRIDVFPLFAVSGSDGAGINIHDRRNRRIVMQEDFGFLWERTLDTPGRWVALPATGDKPRLIFPVVVYDEDRLRALVFGGEDVDRLTPNTTVYQLDLARGRERWHTLITGGDTPPPFVASRAFIDRPHDRLLIYGNSQGDAHRELWELTLTPGSEAWHQIPVARAPDVGPPAGWLPAPDWSAVLLVGGPQWDTTSMSFTTPTSEVWRLELTPGSEAFSQVPSEPPVVPTGAAVGEVDEATETAVLIANDEDFNLQALELDFSTMEWTGPVIGPASAVPSTVAYEPAIDAMVVTTFVTVKDILTFDPDASTWGSVDRLGLDTPAGGSRASFAQTADGLLIPGTSESSLSGSETVWWFDYGSMRFEPAGITADPSHGFPAAVWAAGAACGNDLDLHSSVTFFGGQSDPSSTLAPAEAWSLPLSRGGEWSQVADESASPRPSGRIAALTYSPWSYGGACVGQTVVLGGWSGGTALTDYWLLTDSSGTWIEQPASVTRPTHLAFSAVARDAHQVVKFGGHDGATVTNEVWRQDLCTSGLAPWAQVTPAADPTNGLPPPRAGHTLAVDRDPGTDQTRLIVFGGIDASFANRMNDVWYLEGDGTTWAWRKAVTMGAAPQARAYQVAGWDATGRRMFVFGGEARPGGRTLVMGDSWVLLVKD